MSDGVRQLFDGGDGLDLVFISIGLFYVLLQLLIEVRFEQTRIPLDDLWKVFI